jgi:penicillin-binding protein 2A
VGRMERRQQEKTDKRKIWGFLRSNNIRKRLLSIGIIGVLGSLLLFNIFIWTSDISKLEDANPMPTIIYDQNGEIASKISVSSIEAVSIEKIPIDLINAVVATEDQRFYKHSGINYVSIIRAFFKNLVSGEIVAGGSTVTQQLAKNAFLTHDRTYTRKIKELFLTKKIERTYSKEEIIEMYLNHIYFGEGAWGIQRAAYIYFGKDVSELTLNESAMLAGLIKAPSILSPFKDMDKAVERRDVVLSLMENEGYITQDELSKAKEQAIVLEGKKIEDDYKGKYPFYIDHIISEAINKYGLTKNEILSGGLHIYTELNPTIQNETEKVYQNLDYFPESTADQLLQSGAIFIDSSTGGIKALVGGRGEHTFLGFNRATQLKRQPGSTMKPLAVYTPALEQGYEVYDSLEDQPLNINGYQPNNYDRQFRGQVTMYDALVYSYNVPPVWLLNQMGLDYGINALERFGIPLQKEDHSLPIALGGMQEGTSPLSMAQAFSTFPNDGLMVQAHSIVRIEDANGELLGSWKKNAVRVTDSEVAQKMTYMLKGVVEEGTGSNAQINGIDIAGKTGTTELPFGNIEGAKDHWFVGYTPELVGAVWLGYDHTDENHYLTSSSGETATIIFKEVVSNSAIEFNRTNFDLSLIDNMLEEEEEKQKQEWEKEREKEEKEREKDEEEREKESEKDEKEREKEEKEREKDEKEREKEREKDEDDDD